MPNNGDYERIPERETDEQEDINKGKGILAILDVFLLYKIKVGFIA